LRRRKRRRSNGNSLAADELVSRICGKGTIRGGVPYVLLLREKGEAGF
jgi:hypothetical protein